MEHMEGRMRHAKGNMWKNGANFNGMYSYSFHPVEKAEAASEERLPTRWKRLSEIRGILIRIFCQRKTDLDPKSLELCCHFSAVWLSLRA